MLHETVHQLRQKPLYGGGHCLRRPKYLYKEEHMELIKKRLANLLSVKSLVTLVLTVVFAYLAVEEKIGRLYDGLRRRHCLLLRHPESEGAGCPGRRKGGAR